MKKVKINKHHLAGVVADIWVDDIRPANPIVRYYPKTGSFATESALYDSDDAVDLGTPDEFRALWGRDDFSSMRDIFDWVLSQPEEGLAIFAGVEV